MSGSLYNDYADGLLSERDYLYAKEKYLKQAAEEEQRLSELQEMQRRYETGCRWESRLDSLVQQYRDFDSLTEDIVHSFICKVLVYSDERLEIVFRFEDEFKELKEAVRERRDELCRRKAELSMAADM